MFFLAFDLTGFPGVSSGVKRVCCVFRSEALRSEGVACGGFSEVAGMGTWDGPEACGTAVDDKGTAVVRG